MVVYVTYRVPVEVELEVDTAEIINVHVIDEKLKGPLGIFNYGLVPVGGRLKSAPWSVPEFAESAQLVSSVPSSPCAPHDLPVVEIGERLGEAGQVRRGHLDWLGMAITSQYPQEVVGS